MTGTIHTPMKLGAFSVCGVVGRCGYSPQTVKTTGSGIVAVTARLESDMNM